MKKELNAPMRLYSWWKLSAPVVPPSRVVSEVFEMDRPVHWENIFWDGNRAYAMFYCTRSTIAKEWDEDGFVTHLLPGSSYQPATGWLRRIPYPIRSKKKPCP